jgi:aspartyl-tRNA(Asn)/glutamyl-tRNA(Gln) amidotransferase subunit B
MPELPRQMAERLVQTYGLPEYDATTLTQSKSMADYFEAVAQDSGQPKLAANWVMGEVAALLNKLQVSIDDVEVPGPMQLAALIRRVSDGTISNSGAKSAFQELVANKRKSLEDLAEYLMDVDAVIEAKGLKQMNDTGALEKIIDEVMAANAPMVEQFRAGKDKAFNALVGLVMKASRGKANPQQVNDVLKQKLQ